jgi:uncharacterized membrane protein
VLRERENCNDFEMMLTHARAFLRRKYFCGLALLALYALVTSSSLTIRPLWLDEVLQLVATTSPSVAIMLRWLPSHAVGAVPLGYLTQRPFVLAGGPSAFWSRLPAALFSVSSCWLLTVVCARLKIPPRSILPAAIVFALLPIQFRSATEARPYSEALFLMLASLVAALDLSTLANVRTITLLILATTASLYTQPYAALSVLGVCAWIVVSHFRQGSNWQAGTMSMCLCASVILFFPWYTYSTRQWDNDIRVSGYHFHWSFALLQDVFKGISGGSALCSLVLLVLVVIGFRATPAAIRGPLLSSAASVIVGVLVLDYSRGYFFASRQIAFAAPSLSMLAAAGLTGLRGTARVVAIVLGITLLLTAVKSDVTMQTRSKEDWKAAAMLLAQASDEGYCIRIAGVDQGQIDLYNVFVPRLRAQLCGPLDAQRRVALVSNITMDADLGRSLDDDLRLKGFTVSAKTAVGGTSVALADR